MLQQIYHLSPQMFSLCFAVNGIGLVISAQVSTRFSRRYGEMALVKTGLCIAAVASVALVIAASLGAPLIMLLIPLFFSVMVIGIVSPNAGSLAMQSQGKNAGSASALLGVCMFALGAIAVPVTGFGSMPALSMALTMLGCYAIAIVLFMTLVKKPA